MTTELIPYPTDATGEVLMLPAIITQAGQGAARRFLEFFTVNTQPQHTPGVCQGRSAVSLLVRSTERL